MDCNFKEVSKIDLDREMLKFSLALYNNPLCSNKAVDDTLSSTNEFISNFFIPFIQTQVSNEIKSSVKVEDYSKIIFVLENCKELFHQFSSEHRRFVLYREKS